MKADLIDANNSVSQNLPVSAHRANDKGQVRIHVGNQTLFLDLLDAQALAKAIRKAHGRVQRRG